MGFLLLLLGIIFGIIVLVRHAGGNRTAITYAAITSGLSAAVLVAGLIGISYSRTLALEAGPAVIRQYKSAISVYMEAAIGVGLVSEGELTDIKYQDYQKQVSRMVEHLRYKIQHHNKTLIIKRAVKGNWFWSWVTIAPPEGAKILEL